MLTNTHITGIDPFAPQSTFSCDGLSIPRGMFYGGCFYTAQSFTPPIHVSYIAPGGIWGIADAAGIELAEIHFKNGNPVGDIIGLDGQYAGCLKARKYDYCEVPASGGISTSGGLINGGDLEVFLRSIVRRYDLNADTLIFDISCCTALAPYETSAPTIRAIHLPTDCGLAVDASGNYYMSAITEAGQTTAALQRLEIYQYNDSTPHVLSGSHVSILPWCETPISVNSPVSGSVTLSSGSAKGVQDITVSVVDGAIVIATLGSFDNVN